MTPDGQPGQSESAVESLIAWSLDPTIDTHACNLPGCSCGGAERFSVRHDISHVKPRGPLSRLQAWLQGWPNKHRPWPVLWLGNLVSSFRYWAWRVVR